MTRHRDVPPRGRSTTHPVLAAALVAAGLGCRSTPPPPPLEPPALGLRVQHYAGTSLTGPVTLETAPDSAGALGVSCRVAFLEELPAARLEALSARTRLIGAMRGSDPVLSSALLATGARVGAGEEARELVADLDRGDLGRSLDLATLHAALPVAPTGVTALFSAESEETVDVLDLGEVAKKVMLFVSRDSEGGETPSVVLVVEDVRAPSRLATATAASDDEPPPAEVLRREMICLADEPVPGGGPVVLLLRSPFGGADGAAFLVALEVTAGADEELLRTALAELEPAAEGAEALRDDLGSIRSVASGFRALDEARFHRTGLVFLASTGGAELALDLALAADETALASYVALVRAEREAGATESSGDGGTRSDPGWLLERTAYRFLVSVATQDPPLPPELDGILLRHTGEVGRFPVLLGELVAQAADAAALRDRLLAENEIFLEDASPAARIRAFDWLAARGAAPAGFDPLAEDEARREALAVVREAAAETGEGARP